MGAPKRRRAREDLMRALDPRDLLASGWHVPIGAGFTGSARGGGPVALWRGVGVASV